MPHSVVARRRAGCRGLAAALGLVLAAHLPACQGPPVPLEDTYRRIARKNELLSQMRIGLLKSVECEKSAVMCPTDEGSRAYADQSLAEAAEVQRNLEQLDSLVAASALPDEQRLLAEFGTCWASLRGLNQVILDLAVQNTNLKAARLSCDQGAEALRRFERALEVVMGAGAPTQDEGRVTRLAYRAITACLRIHHLHSVHIPESEDAAMDRFEAQIRAEEREAASALDELAQVTGAAGRKPLAEAKAAFAEFAEVTARVLALSRQNSNVRSMELSLGKERLAAAACDEILAAFQEVVDNRTSRATR